MLLKEEPALNFQQCFVFPTCSFFPQSLEKPPRSAAPSGPAETPCPSRAGFALPTDLKRAVGKPSALPPFSLPLPTGIRLSGSKILPAIFKAST